MAGLSEWAAGLTEGETSRARQAWAASPRMPAADAGDSARAEDLIQQDARGLVRAEGHDAARARFAVEADPDYVRKWGNTPAPIEERIRRRIRGDDFREDYEKFMVYARGQGLLGGPAAVIGREFRNLGTAYSEERENFLDDWGKALWGKQYAQVAKSARFARIDAEKSRRLVAQARAGAQVDGAPLDVAEGAWPQMDLTGAGRVAGEDPRLRAAFDAAQARAGTLPTGPSLWEQNAWPGQAEMYGGQTPAGVSAQGLGGGLPQQAPQVAPKSASRVAVLDYIRTLEPKSRRDYLEKLARAGARVDGAPLDVAELMTLGIGQKSLESLDEMRADALISGGLDENDLLARALGREGKRDAARRSYASLFEPRSRGTEEYYAPYRNDRGELGFVRRTRDLPPSPQVGIPYQMGPNGVPYLRVSNEGDYSRRDLEQMGGGGNTWISTGPQGARATPFLTDGLKRPGSAPAGPGRGGGGSGGLGMEPSTPQITDQREIEKAIRRAPKRERAKLRLDWQAQQDLRQSRSDDRAARLAESKLQSEDSRYGTDTLARTTTAGQQNAYNTALKTLEQVDRSDMSKLRVAETSFDRQLSYRAFTAANKLSPPVRARYVASAELAKNRFKSLVAPRDEWDKTMPEVSGLIKSLLLSPGRSEAVNAFLKQVEHAMGDPMASSSQKEKAIFDILEKYRRLLG